MSLAKAKRLRKQMTEAEQRLRYWLRANRLSGYKFRRQVPIGPYIVDFVCFAHKLVIEVDGGQHADSIGDRVRDAWLERRGFRILRFWNHDVLGATDIVLDEVARALGLIEG